MDRLLRWTRDIRRATYFDIQNVADYYFTHQAEDQWQTQRDFTVAPPFDFFATLYTLPDSMPAEFRSLEILTVFRVVTIAPRSNLTILAEGVDISPYPPALVPAARWHLLAQTFSARKRQVTPPVDWFMAVDELGRIIDHRGHIALWLTDTHSPAGVGIIADTFLQVSLLALTFLHCKNVQIVRPPPPTKKRLPRKVKFESRYHRLRVDAVGRRGGQSRVSETGIKQSLHIVRGHFREYGSQFGKGKLFGKYSGRFWVASHISGRADVGLVAKDYEINAPEEK